MDTTKEYSLMCEKSYEDVFPLLSEQLRPGTLFKFSDDNSCRILIRETELDYAEKLYNYEVINLSTGVRYTTSNITEDAFIIWGQDQLQKIMGKLHSRPFYEVMNFMDRMMMSEEYYNAPNIKKEYPNQYEFNSPKVVFDSMEQLWLAFVMKEKFHKIWNGEDWINKV